MIKTKENGDFILDKQKLALIKAFDTLLYISLIALVDGTVRK